MHNIHETVRRFLLTVVACTSLAPLVGAQTRTEITINDTGVHLVSSEDFVVISAATLH